MKKTKLLLILIISVTILLSLSFTFFSFINELNRKKLPVLGQIKDFTLINENGEDYRLSRLKGKVWIADFFFTTCSDICPVMTKNMAALHRTFEKVSGVCLVSITVNPEYDTSAILKTFAQKQDADDNWIFLTGDREVITALAVNSFKLGSVNEPVFHSAHFSLVDRNGFIRGYYEGTDQERINQLFKDTALLLKEKM